MGLLAVLRGTKSYERSKGIATSWRRQGQYEKDMKNGEGVFIWPDGRSYRGQWLGDPEGSRRMVGDSGCCSWR